MLVFSISIYFHIRFAFVKIIDSGHHALYKLITHFIFHQPPLSVGGFSLLILC